MSVKIKYDKWTRRYYLEATGTTIPVKLFNFRNHYKQIGRTLYVVIPGPGTSIPKVTKTPTLGDLVKKYGQGTPFTMVQKALDRSSKTTLRKATDSEIAAYTEAKAAFDAFVNDDLKKTYAKRIERATKDVQDAHAKWKSAHKHLVRLENKLAAL